MAGAWPFLGTFFDHGAAPGASWGPFRRKHYLVFSKFWVPLDTQKSPKNRSLAKKAAPGIVCLGIFVTNVVLLTLGLDFSLIFHEISMQKFPNQRTLFGVLTSEKNILAVREASGSHLGYLGSFWESFWLSGKLLRSILAVREASGSHFGYLGSFWSLPPCPY